MSTKIRKDLRETNSSSTHVIAFKGRNDIKLPSSITFNLDSKTHNRYNYLYTCIYIYVYKQLKEKSKNSLNNIDYITIAMDQGSYTYKTDLLKSYQDCISKFLKEHGVVCKFGTFLDYCCRSNGWEIIKDEDDKILLSITGETQYDRDLREDFELYKEKSDEWKLITALMDFIFEEKDNEIFIKKDNFLDYLMTAEVGAYIRDFIKDFPFGPLSGNYNVLYKSDTEYSRYEGI